MGDAGERPPSTQRRLEEALSAREGAITVEGAREAIGSTRSLSSVRTLLQKLVQHGYMERRFEVVDLRRVAVYTKTEKWDPPHRGLWVQPPGHYGG